jgi:AcrR family transcriptional regulator
MNRTYSPKKKLTDRSVKLYNEHTISERGADMMREDLRIRKGRESKEKIIHVAMQLIAEEGMEGLSAKKIADRAGLSKSNVFHHFSSVEQILDTLFEEMLQSTVTPILSFQGSSLEAFLQSLGESIFRSDEQQRLAHQALLGYYAASLYKQEYQFRLFKAKQDMLAAIAAQLKQYSQQDNQTIERVAQMILITLDGYGLHHLLEAEEQNVEQLWTLQCALWQSMLK